jgi:amino acid-DNA transferase-like protein
VDIRDFGIALIKTEDLDPVYTGLYRAKLPEAQLCRLLFSYMCFYHLGASAWLSEHEGNTYWVWMGQAAANEFSPPTINHGRWPRGTERRHFRGQKCIDAMRWFTERFAPEAPVRMSKMLTTEKMIISEVSKWPMFGPWIGFKTADLIERVYGSPVQFDPNLGLLYDSPRDALNLLATDDKFITVNHEPEALYNNLMTYFAATKAPPRYDRYVNAQEVETILCKWGSMKSGHYWVGKDIHEIRAGLTGWGETAQRILAVMPEEVAT